MFLYYFLIATIGGVSFACCDNLITVPLVLGALFTLTHLHTLVSIDRLSVFVVICLFFILLASLVSILGGDNNFKLTYFFAYIGVFFLNFFPLYIYLIRNKADIFSINSRQGIPYILFSVFSLFFIVCMVDYFALANNYDLKALVGAERYGTPVMIGIASRPSGFFSEPTDAALFFNLLFPISLVYAHKARKLLLFFSMALILLFTIRSAVGVGALILALAIGGQFREYLKEIFLVVFVTAVLVASNDHLTNVVGDVISKIFLFKDAPSVNERTASWSFFFNLYASSSLWDLILGKGPGWIASSYEDITPHSWYLTLLVEHGFFGLIFILLIVLLPVGLMFGINTKLSKAVLTTQIAVLIHFFTYSGFFNPFLWISLAISYAYTYDFYFRRKV